MQQSIGFGVAGDCSGQRVVLNWVACQQRDVAQQEHFRLGTEYNWAYRFSGTQEQFCRLYDHAAAAVKRVLRQVGEDGAIVKSADADPEATHLLPTAGAKHVRHTAITRTDTDESLRDRLLCEDRLMKQWQDIKVLGS